MTNKPPAAAPSSPPPGVILWFKIYAGLMCFFNILVIVGSVLYLLRIKVWFTFVDADFLLVMSVPLLVVCFLPLVLRPRNWLWTYNLAVICIGMTSVFCLPICIPLLIYWIRPEVREYYRTQ